MNEVAAGEPGTGLRRKVGAGLWLGLAGALLAGCGSQYRPVVSSVNPVGPAAQPTKYAIAISTNNAAGAAGTGLVTFVDFAGDTILNTTSLGKRPTYLMLDAGGTEAYTLNYDGTLNSFGVQTNLLSTNVLQTTLPTGSTPTAIYPQGTYLYVADPAHGVSQLSQVQPPAIQSVLPTGAAAVQGTTPVAGTGTIYTVGSPGGTRAYALVGGGAGVAGTAAAIETTTNTVSAQIPVGVNPVYGVMSVDPLTAAARRAFVLNNGSGTVTVINAQTNALDTFTPPNAALPGTIRVGVAPIWAELVPELNEVVVANAGGGTAATPGSLSIISIPLCTATTVTTNPNCDVNNPVDAVGFGTVVATVPLGVNPIQVVILGDGSRAYIANAGNAAAGIAGSISVVNLTTNTVTQTIPAGTSSNVNDLLVHGHPGYLAVTNGTPTGKVYVTAPDSTDLTIIRTDTDSVLTHLSLQGNGVSVRTNRP